MPMKQRVFVGLAVALIVAIGAIAWAGLQPHPTDWDAGYEADPVAADPVSAGDDHFRELKQELRWRLDQSQDFSTIGALGTQTGEFLEGTARAFKVASCDDGPPIVPPTVNAEYDAAAGNYGGAAVLDLDDDGALCKDDTTGELEVFDGATESWEQAVTAINTDVDIIDAAAPGAPAVGHTLNAGFETYIHNHGVRHTDMTTAAGVDGEDFDYEFFGWSVKNVVQSAEGALIGWNSAAPGVACSGGNANVMVTQAINMAGRRVNNRVLVVAQLFAREADAGGPGVGGANAFAYIDMDGVQVGQQREVFPVQGARNDYIMIELQTGLTAANHTWELCGESTGGTVSFRGRFTIIDFGPII